MQFYNLDPETYFEDMVVQVAGEHGPCSASVRLRAGDYEEWVVHIGRAGLERVLKQVIDLLGSPLQMALTAAIRIQLVTTGHMPGVLLIGVVPMVPDWAALLDDEIDGIVGDIYRHQYANNGPLQRSPRTVDRKLRFDRADGPWIELSHLRQLV